MTDLRSDHPCLPPSLPPPFPPAFPFPSPSPFVLPFVSIISLSFSLALCLAASVRRCLVLCRVLSCPVLLPRSLPSPAKKQQRPCAVLCIVERERRGLTGQPAWRACWCLWRGESMRLFFCLAVCVVRCRAVPCRVKCLLAWSCLLARGVSSPRPSSVLLGSFIFAGAWSVGLARPPKI